MKRMIIPIAAVLTALIAGSAQSDPPIVAQQPTVAQKAAEKSAENPKPTKVLPLMQLKLEKSKKILEGLALEDYDMIGKHARSLKLLSLEAGWDVIQTEEYATQSRDFRRTCDLIAKAAKEKEIGRAALGYVALTVRCVECHAYMREHKVDIARAPSLETKPSLDITQSK
ncbi:MAG: hypothetical protein ACPGLY_06805 [Rubripirellula sp.]